jgi:hypothetical protein
MSLERIEPMVAQDPALAAEIIKLANDGFLKGSLKPVTRLVQGLGVLESERLRTILLKALLRPSIPIKPIFYHLVGRPLWDHARDCAMACKTLAPNHLTDADDGYLLGLIHDAGKLMIFKLLCSAFRATSATVSPRAGIVARMVHRYANELSHCLAQHWNFPASFLDATEEQGAIAPARMSPLGRTLFQGNLVAEAYVVMQKHRFSRSTLDEALRRFDLSLELVYSIFPAAPRPRAPGALTPLPRAARELCHVPGKGPRAEPEPLDHGEVGEESFGEVPHGQTAVNGERGRLDDLTAFRGQHLGAEQAPAPALGDELDESPGVEVGERPRHVIPAQGAAVDLEALLPRLRRRQAHDRDLRIRERDLGHGGQVQGRLPAHHVDRCTGAGRRGDIHERWLCRAISGGIDTNLISPLFRYLRVKSSPVKSLILLSFVVSSAS